VPQKATVGADVDLRAATDHERTVLLSFYEAGIYAYRVTKGLGRRR
jgi:hypothetical protein